MRAAVINAGGAHALRARFLDADDKPLNTFGREPGRVASERRGDVQGPDHYRRWR